MIALNLAFSLADRYAYVGRSADVLSEGKFFMEFSFYFLRDKDHMWNARFGGDVHILKGLRVFLYFELIADPESPIFFRPRSVYFSEGFYYRLGDFTLGYTHRCKHDIDDLKRITILGGFRMGYVRGQTYTYLELYPIRYDRSYPEVTKRSTVDLFGSVGFSLDKRDFGGFVRLDVAKWGLDLSVGLRISYTSEERSFLKASAYLERFYDTAMNRQSTPALLGRFGLSTGLR